MTAGEGVGAEARFERLSTGVGEVSVEAEWSPCQLDTPFGGAFGGDASAAGKRRLYGLKRILIAQSSSIGVPCHKVSCKSGESVAFIKRVLRELREASRTFASVLCGIEQGTGGP
jgi:hypothetical protein